MRLVAQLGRGDGKGQTSRSVRTKTTTAAPNKPRVRADEEVELDLPKQLRD